MNAKTIIYLKKKFQEYYTKTYINTPTAIQNREFGFGNFEKKIAFRHRSFKSYDELNKYLRLNAPFYVSYSSAYYEFPDAEMSKKNWLGADLIFDFDAENFIEKKNFEKVRDECLKLIDFLKYDFGFKDIRTNFSGSKGFHIKVFDEKIRKLGKDERIEILDYITGNGIRIENFFNKRIENGIEFLCGPGKDAKGWGKRINLLAQEILKQKVMSKRVKNEKKYKLEKILEEIKLGKWENFDKEVGQNYLKNIIKNKAVNLTPDTDRQVSQDITRLIRLENSLHGETGFIAKIIDIEKFSFENFIEVLAFGDEKIKIFLNDDFKFFLLNYYNLKKGVCEIPEYVGVYLLLKGKGEIYEN